MSQEIGYRKPEKETYEHVLNAYPLKPEEILFLDDMPQNIDGARNAGMQAIHVISFEQMRDDINKILKQ